MITSRERQDLLQTKLHRPRVTADLVHRPRLTNILNDGLDRPLILVAGALNTLVEKTEGWAVALRFAALTLRYGGAIDGRPWWIAGRKPLLKTITRAHSS